MMTRILGIRPPLRLLFALLLFAIDGLAQSAELPVDSNLKIDSGAPATSGKSIRKHSGPSASKRAKQPTRHELPPVSTRPQETANVPTAVAGVDGTQNQVQEVPCFKTKLCE